MADVHEGFEVGILLTGAQERHSRDFVPVIQPGDIWLCGTWEPHGWRVLSPGTQHGLCVFLAGHLGDERFAEVSATEVVNAPSGQSYQHLCLAVDDIEPTVSDLRPRGVEVTEPEKGNDQSWQAWLADTGGNRIELHQYTPESWQTPSLTWPSGAASVGAGRRRANSVGGSSRTARGDSR
ncbi:MAG: VOC family protein [Armatimonadota bacterium]|jgi:hypothetical protein